jgi:hypothetical protein
LKIVLHEIEKYSNKKSKTMPRWKFTLDETMIIDTA